MAVTGSAARTAAKKPVVHQRAGVELTPFVWQGTDKRGKKMKGEQTAKNANLLRAELRRQGITPTVVKPKSKPLFGRTARTISAIAFTTFIRYTAVRSNSDFPTRQKLEIIVNGNNNGRMKAELDS